MQRVHQLTRDDNGGERETIFRMIAEDVQGEVGTLEFITSSLFAPLNTSHHDMARLLTDEVLHGLLIKCPSRIPPSGEQLSHSFELGPGRSQIEEMSPSRVTDLFRSCRDRFETNPA